MDLQTVQVLDHAVVVHDGQLIFREEDGQEVVELLFSRISRILLPALLAYIRLLRKGTAKKAPETWIIFIGLIGFLIATYFNPWMNAALGIAWYGLTAAAVWTLSARSEEGPEFLEVK